MHGRLGVDLARQHHPDLMLLDLNRPGITSREVLGDLLVDPRTAHIPVLVVSADTSSGQIRRLADAGAAGYLTKPIDFPTFLNEIYRILIP